MDANYRLVERLISKLTVIIMFAGIVTYTVFHEGFKTITHATKECVIDDSNIGNLTVYIKNYTVDYLGEKINITYNYILCYQYYGVYYLSYETISYQICADLFIMFIIIEIFIWFILYLIQNHSFYKN